MTAISCANIAGSGGGITAASVFNSGSTAWGASDKLITCHASWEAQTSDNRTISSVAGATLTFADSGAGRVAQAIDGTFSAYHQVFYVYGNGNTEVVTVTFSGSVSAARIHFVRTSGDTNTSAPIVQKPTGTGTSATPSITMAAFADGTNNACLASFSTPEQSDHTPKSGFTELHDFGQGGIILVYTEYRLGSDTTPNYTGGASAAFAGIALEIAAPSSGNTLAKIVGVGGIVGPSLIVGRGSIVGSGN